MEKTIKLGKLKLRYYKTRRSTYLHINFGRYKKGKINTLTLYDGIIDDPKSMDTIWMDVQKKPIGLEIHLR